MLLKRLGGFSIWGYYRPNDFGGYQTCVLLSPDVSYKFDDDNCGQTVAGYICQLRMCKPTHIAYIHWFDISVSYICVYLLI